jgi:hypothetical protein
MDEVSSMVAQAGKKEAKIFSDGSACMTNMMKVKLVIPTKMKVLAVFILSFLDGKN